MKQIKVLIVALVAIIFLTACSKADRVSHNLSREAKEINNEMDFV